jgi:hypothetical protein
MENWKVISFNKNYEVSDNGRIRNAKTKRILSIKPTKSHKHPQVFLHGNMMFTKMQFTVSHIVYDHFVGEEGFNNTTGNPYSRIGHYDGNILNNKATNLFRKV